MTTSAIRNSLHPSDSSCSQPEKAGWIERTFKLSEQDSNVQQETIASINGGRTGLMAVVAGLIFLLVIFFSPLQV